MLTPVRPSQTGGAPMSCKSNGVSCETPRRHGALAVLAVMLIIFTALSVFSFLKSRGQVTPDMVSYGPYQAASGKRVFQAYNCMGCHTMVGNGAYLGPDLTKEYAQVGPAWLAAFLPSAGSWPTAAAVGMQLQNPDQLTDTKIKAIEAYYEKFPRAKARIDRRGGHPSFMPNLPFSKEEIGQLIAYLKYVSEMNTEGWPPQIKVEPGVIQAAAMPAAASATAAAMQPPPVKVADPAARGAELVKDFGCTACHSAGTDRVVGPGWGGLYGSTVALADGDKVKADDAYLIESIRRPNAKVVADYPPDVMPGYAAKQLSDGDVTAIVAYLRSLGTTK